MFPDVAQLRALSAVCEHGSFEAAARALNITPSAVSQRIKALETSVGRVVVQRTKPPRASEAGLVLLRLARRIDLLVDDASAEIDGSSSTGMPVVPLAVNSDSLATWLLPALAVLAHKIAVDLHRDDQEHTAALLRDGTVLGAITAARLPVSGCTSELLGAMRYRPVCSPEFGQTWFDGFELPDALANAPVVVFDRKDELQDAWVTTRTGSPVSAPRHHVPASNDFVEAVRLGFGWGMVPDLQRGIGRMPDALVELDAGAFVDVRLYWQQWSIGTAALTEVASAIRTAASTALLAAAAE